MYQGRGGRRRRGIRDRQAEPCIEAPRPILMVEPGVAPDVQIGLLDPERRLDREDEADLRADAEHARLETTDLVARSAVAAKLLVDIADRTDLELFSEELRRRPVHMEVDAVLVL